MDSGSTTAPENPGPGQASAPSNGRWKSRIVNAVIFGAMIGLVGVFVYGFAQTEKCGSQTLNYLFMALAAIGLLFLASTLRRSLERRINLVLVIVSAAIAVYLLEIALYAVLQVAHDRARIARSEGKPFDSRSQLQVIRDLRKDGVQAYPAVSPQQFMGSEGLLSTDGRKIFPLAGISLHTTVLCNEGGAYATYRSDEHGFNNPPGIWGSGPIDIVLTGDSLVHGQCVDPSHTVAANLRRITKKKVLNLAFHGTGPLAQLGTVREYAGPMRPKIVLWHYYEGNDQSDLVEEARCLTLMEYLKRDYSQRLINRQGEIDKTLEWYINSYLERTADQSPLRRIPFGFWAKLTSLRLALGVVSDSHHCDYDLFAKVMERARDEVSSWGGELYLVYLPEYSRYAARDFDDQWRKKVLTIAKRLGIQSIDVLEAFAAHPDCLSLFPFRIAGHYTEEGYRLVATVVANSLATNGSATGTAR